MVVQKYEWIFWHLRHFLKFSTYLKENTLIDRKSSLPDIVYVFLSYFPETNLLWINICIFIEQFGYGFVFTAYMLYLIYFSRGTHSTAHYAICTAFMALGMMLPGMIAGWMQELLGYQHFFLWIMVCCAATFGVTALLKIDPEFGKKQTE